MDLPVIKAEFLLDDKGKPKVRASRHYEIKVYVQDTPSDTHKVTYYLDPTYFDPVREARDGASQFAEELTSYGDYIVQAKIRTSDHSILAKRSLFEALHETYGNAPDPSIQKALDDIRDN